MDNIKGVIVFDMDGTIADLYGVDNWLEQIRAFDPTPYAEAEPMVDMALLNVLLHKVQEIGYKVAVTSWLSMTSTKEYDKAVRKAKRDWLDEYDFPYDECHLVKYGTRKNTCTKKYDCPQILFDDNADIRKGWKGDAYAPDEIFEVLEQLIREGE